MNCSFWAEAGIASATPPSAAARARARCFSIVPPPADLARESAAADVPLLPLLCSRFGRPSIRERPQPELFFPDRPQPGEPVRLHDQEEYDEGAEQHEFDMRDRRRRQADSQEARQLIEEDRGQHDEGGPEERSEDRAKP